MYQTDSGLLVVGEQVPRILYTPPAAVPELGSAGERVEELAAEAGLVLDPWQAAFIAEACTYRKETYRTKYSRTLKHKWAAYQVGLMVSRQNGKGSILEARELAGLFLFEERLIIHSAHQFDTSKEAFIRIVGLIENTPSLRKQVKAITRSHGEEGIELMTGQRLRFRTRTGSGGRGFTADCIIFDEAMILGSGMVKSLLPTLGTLPNAQVWYTGSAGGPESEQFGRVRQMGLEGIDPRLLYAEWSAEICDIFCPPNCTDHDDPWAVETWAKANPSLNIIRIDGSTGLNQEVIEGNQSMGLVDFSAEHLGVGDWPSIGEGWRVIRKPNWEAQARESSIIDVDRPIAMGIDVSPDSSTSSIGLAGYSMDKLEDDGDIFHIELARSEDSYDHRHGTQWVVDRAWQIYERAGISCIIIDPTTPAGVFIEPLLALGANVIKINSREYGQSCIDFKNGVAPIAKEDTANVVHVDQPPLNSAVGVANVRKLTDLWAFSKDKSTADISPLVAVDLALWGLKNHGDPVVDPWMYRG